MTDYLLAQIKPSRRRPIIPGNGSQGRCVRAGPPTLLNLGDDSEVMDHETTKEAGSNP
jgi:hypothetical protein